MLRFTISVGDTSYSGGLTLVLNKTNRIGDIKFNT